jgi:thioredoxin reductase (NADPH)
MTTEEARPSAGGSRSGRAARAQQPVIVAVDDDPDVLAAVRRDLRRRYGDDYRIVAADGGPEGLEAVIELHRRGAQVAVLVVDQRMPELEGTDLLVEAKKHHPDAGPCC